MPLVSVIIPTYNHQDLVQDTLNSVFAQTFTDYELIVINDGSPDNTGQLLQPLAEAGKIRYIEQENQGQAKARNLGIAEAKGQFIALLDDDDLWPPDKLLRQVEALQRHPDAVLVYGEASFFSDAETLNQARKNGGSKVEVVKRWMRNDFLTHNFVTSPGQTLIRSAVLKKIGGFDTNIWGVDDWELYIRLASQGKFISLNGTIALFYRKHANNASKNTKRMLANSLLVFYKHFGRRPFIKHKKYRATCYRWVIVGYSYACLWNAQELLEAGQTWPGIKKWFEGIRKYPRLLAKPSMFKLVAKSFRQTRHS